MAEVSPHLKPKAFDFLQAHPTLSGELVNRVAHGYIDIKPNIRKIHEHSVEFEDGSLVEVDVIIMATGYDFEIPFLEKGVLEARSFLSP